MIPGQITPYLDMLRARTPSVRIETIEDTGHLPQIDEPDRTNALLNSFIAALRRNQPRADLRWRVAAASWLKPNVLTLAVRRLPYLQVCRPFATALNPLGIEFNRLPVPSVVACPQLRNVLAHWTTARELRP
jgi:hypothetical protein